MITKEEILQGQKCPEGMQDDLNELVTKVNIVRAAYAKPMTVSSGLRTMKHHLEIYAAKGITDKSKIPMKSKHLYCQAVDFRDVDGSLYAWMKANPKVMEQADIYCELSTVGWLHCQSVPFGSYKAGGSRWFNA